MESFDKDAQYYSPLLHYLKRTEIGDLVFIPLIQPVSEEKVLRLNYFIVSDESKILN